MTNDVNRPSRMREHADQLAAQISDSPGRGRDVSQEPRIPKGQAGAGQWTTGGSSQGSRRSQRLANSHTPAPFVDDQGNPVLSRDGKPMQRPSDVDMRFFVDQGLVAKAGSQIAAYANLFKFHQGNAWDIQRVGSDTKSTESFIDAANVAIGLYAAAAGLPKDTTLGIANDYAAVFSNYRNAPKDQTYTHLSKQDAEDMRLGYALYQSGKVGPSPVK